MLLPIERSADYSVNTHSSQTTNKRGKEVQITSDKFLIATGGRPKYPDIPGAKEYCITR